MASTRTTTEPMLVAPNGRGPAGGAGSEPRTARETAPPSGAATDPDGAPLFAPGDEAVASAGAPDDANGDAASRAIDILQNMKPARVWSPKPATSAESQGASFAAYHAVHSAPKRHDTPPPASPVEIAPVTVPPAADHSDTVMDLGTAIERAQAREQAARDARAPTVVPRAPEGPRGVAVFGAALAVVVVVLGVLVATFSGVGRTTSPPSSAASGIVTPPVASAVTGAPRPDVPSSAAASTATAVPAAAPSAPPVAPAPSLAAARGTAPALVAVSPAPTAPPAAPAASALAAAAPAAAAPAEGAPRAASGQPRAASTGRAVPLSPSPRPNPNSGASPPPVTKSPFEKFLPEE